MRAAGRCHVLLLGFEADILLPRGRAIDGAGAGEPRHRNVRQPPHAAVQRPLPLDAMAPLR
jgi:hypothetical protein